MRPRDPAAAMKPCLLGLLLALRAGLAAAQATHELPKNTSLFLPSSGGTSASWAAVPEGDAVARYGRFTVGPKEAILYADEGSSLFDPVSKVERAAGQRIQDFAFLNDELVLATSLGLGTLEGAPPRFKLAYLLPGSRLNLAVSDSGSLFVARKDPRTGKTTILVVRGLKSLTGGRDGKLDADKVVELDHDVSAIAGDGETVYAASGRLILKAARGGKTVETVFLHPTQEITGVAYVPGAGLFYATPTAVGHVGAGAGEEFLTSPHARITARGGSLFIMFDKDKDILRLQGLKGFSKP